MTGFFNKGYCLLLIVLGFVAFFTVKAFCLEKDNFKTAFVEVKDNNYGESSSNSEDKKETEKASSKEADTVKEEVKKENSEVKKKKKKKSKVLAVGDEFFSFNIKTIDNDSVNLDNYLGKRIIVLKFGSIYCSSCISSIPKLAKIQDKYKKEVQIIEVNLDIYGRGRVRKFYKSLKAALNYPVIVDKGLKVSRQYGVSTLPTNVVIDKEGIIRYISRGYSELEEENLEDVINSILGKKEIAIATARKDRLSILMPLNITKTFQEDVYVIGRVTTPGIKIEMTLNGGSKQSVKTNKEMYYFRTPLSLGSNYIEVKVTDSAQAEDTKAVVIFREAKFGGMTEPVPFPEYKFHVEENEEYCSKCHELIPPATDEGVVVTEFCLKCHAELLKDQYVHGPISVGGCLPCHEFESKPNRYELKAKRAALCYICHSEKQEELEKENLHGPMAAGICVLCHNPHSAPYKFQLQRWGGELCYFCHGELRRYQASKYQHPPFRNGECTKCHGPHSSDSKQYFLNRVELTDLCFICHKPEDMENHRHKVGIVPTKVKVPASSTLDKKGRLICTTCHNPHGSEGEKMLPAGGCQNCHKEN